MTNPRLLPALLLALALPACGAKVESYEPTLQGIVNEGFDPNDPTKDVSFADGERVTRVADTACGGPYSAIIADVYVDNQYRNRTVKLRYVNEACQEREGATIPPGEAPIVAVQDSEIIRVYDAADGALLSSWQARLNSIKTERIVLRSASPDI